MIDITEQLRVGFWGIRITVCLPTTRSAFAMTKQHSYVA